MLRGSRLRLVGYVAEHRVMINIADAYEDTRFNSKVDEQMGSKAHT